MYFWHITCASRSQLTAHRKHMCQHWCRGSAHRGGPQIGTCRRYWLIVNPYSPASMFALRHRPIQEGHRRTRTQCISQSPLTGVGQLILRDQLTVHILCGLNNRVWQCPYTVNPKLGFVLFIYFQESFFE